MARPAHLSARENDLPTLPTWSGLHPLAVHFPVALLTLAPLLVAVGLWTRPDRGVLAVAFLVMTLGTLAAWVAASSGESAGQLAERLPGVAAALDDHAELGEATRTLFTALSLAYGGLLGVPRALRRAPSRAARLGLHGAFLVLYVAALGVLATTAAQGGRLVHELGVHAVLGPGPGGAPQARDGARMQPHHEIGGAPWPSASR